MGGAAGGEDVIDEKQGCAFQRPGKSGEEGVAEIFTAGGGGESDLFGSPADFFEPTVGERFSEKETPFAGEEFGGVVGAGDALEPVLGNGEDGSDGVVAQLSQNIGGGDAGEGADEAWATGMFPANSDIAEKFIVEAPTEDPFKGEGSSLALGAGFLGIEMGTDRFAAASATGGVYADRDVGAAGLTEMRRGGVGGEVGVTDETGGRVEEFEGGAASVAQQIQESSGGDRS